VKVIKLPTRIDVDNVMDIIKDYDLVIDGSDNFDTRYLVNDACYLAGKTNVTAPSSSSRAWPRSSPRTRGPLPLSLSDTAPTGPRPLLKRGGRPGRAPGIIGVVQATEAVKISSASASLSLGGS